MKIQYVNNTCDIDGLSDFGEIMVFLKDGRIIYHHDKSDGGFDSDTIQSFLKAVGVEIEFERIEPTEEQIDEIDVYLGDYY
jgi:hypothetical protein